MNVVTISPTTNGWILLAEAILQDYSEQYASQFPKNAKSQQEYTALDLLYYQPIREHIMSNLIHGPIKHMADPCVCKRAFDLAREAYKQLLNVEWVG